MEKVLTAVQALLACTHPTSDRRVSFTEQDVGQITCIACGATALATEKQRAAMGTPSESIAWSSPTLVQRVCEAIYVDPDPRVVAARMVEDMRARGYEFKWKDESVAKLSHSCARWNDDRDTSKGARSSAAASRTCSKATCGKPAPFVNGFWHCEEHREETDYDTRGVRWTSDTIGQRARRAIEDAARTREQPTVKHGDVMDERTKFDDVAPVPDTFSRNERLSGALGPDLAVEAVHACERYKDDHDLSKGTCGKPALYQRRDLDLWHCDEHREVDDVDIRTGLYVGDASARAKKAHADLEAIKERQRRTGVDEHGYSLDPATREQEIRCQREAKEQQAIAPSPWLARLMRRWTVGERCVAVMDIYYAIFEITIEAGTEGTVKAITRAGVVVVEWPRWKDDFATSPDVLDPIGGVL